MKKAFLLVAFVVGFAVVSAATVTWAASTGNVAATVTVENISVTVSDGTVAYGTMALNTIKTTTTTGDTQTITNNGNVSVDLTVRGSSTTPGNWGLSPTAAGSSIYMHKFCTSTCTSVANYTAMNSSTYTNMKSDLTTTTATQSMDLLINTPTAVSDYTQQSMVVTVSAAAH